VAQKLQHSNEIVRLVDIGVLEEDYSSEWDSPSFAIAKKNGSITVVFVTDFRKLNLLLKRRMSPISYSKDQGHDPFNGRVYLCFIIVLKYGPLLHQTRCYDLFSANETCNEKITKSCCATMNSLECLQTIRIIPLMA
jgi:hypothetical protein